MARVKNVLYGAEHFNWKGDNITAHSGRGRALKLFKNIGPCCNCGAEKSERHHIDGNTLNNSPENIKILCRRCHQIEDGRIKKFATPFTNGIAKLSYEKAAEIRRSQEGGGVLARRYGVSISLISLVRLGKIWK